MVTKDVLIGELQKEISELRFRIEALESQALASANAHTKSLELFKIANLRIDVVERSSMKLLGLIEMMRTIVSSKK